MRNFDFQELEQKCRLYAEFKNDTEWLYYPQLFNMACNFANIEGGEKNFLNIIENSKHDTYHSRNWKVIFNEIRHLCYRPTNCMNFCPYYDTCNHASNMILTAKTPKKEIVKIGTPQYITLEQMEQKLKNTFDGIIKDKSNSIHLISAQTGAGKTQEYIDLMKEGKTSTLAICCPIHKLIKDLKKRCKENGIPIKVAQELPILEDKKLYNQIIKYYKLGLYIEADKLINGEISKLTDNFFNFPLTPTEKADCKKLKKYYDNNKNILDFEGNIIITHNKLLHIDQRILKDRTIIIDEDILQDLLPIDKISLEDLTITNYIDSTAITKEIEKKLEIVKNSNYNTIIPVNEIPLTKERNFTEKEIKNVMYDISSNLFNFCKCTAVLKINSSIKEGEPIDHSKDILYCSIKNTLPNCKIIVLSATVNEKLYKGLFPHRNIVFHEIGEVEYQGKVYQNYQNSFSKSSLKLEDTTILDTFNELQEKYVKAGFEPITYKDYTLSRHDIYFRKLVGVDFLNGSDCLVLGTPHLPQEIYKLMAYQIYGVEIKDSWRPQEVTYNDYKFFFNTFTDNRLQELHLWSVESELEQSVGRARPLRNDCQVHVYSNFPVKQAIFKDKDLLK